METIYLIAGGSAVLTIVLVFFIARSLILARKKLGDIKPSQQKSGLTVATGARKDERLTSDFILGAIEDGVVMVGHDNLIQLFNPAATTITGWPAPEAVGLEYHTVVNLVNEKGELLPPESHPFAKVLIGNQTIRDNQQWLATRGGKRIPVSIIVSPLLDARGAAQGSVVGMLRDISKEKAEEAQRSEFISTASHEMRTPLAAIEGYVALALNEKTAQIDANARKYLDKAAVATKHLGVLFQDLLTSSRAEDGRLTSFPVVIELGEIVQQVAEAARFHAKEKGLTVRYVVSSDQSGGGKVIRPLYYTYVDPHRISEVIQNIVDNAIKYTPEGSVTIRMTGDKDVIQIQVQDTGPGIPSDDLPHLFQKFYRVDNSMTRSVGGSGLGLFISRKIVDLYNGRIWAESHPGQGSTFIINLPRLTTSQALEIQKNQTSPTSPLDIR